MDAVEEIKDRLSIEDVVGRYVDLKRSGSSYKGLCPFHQEKTPSFYVTPSKGIYKCFGCSKSGDVFTFLMEMEKLAFPEALRRLAQQAGVSLPEHEPRQASLKGQLYEANEAAARYFADALTGPQGAKARDYLKIRGFGTDAIELFGLGYAPDGRDGLVRHLHAAGLDDRVLLAAGLGLQEDVGGGLRDRFRARLMFPIRDGAGRLTGFGGRTLGEAQPKYLNSPQTEIFDKSSVLFGIQRAQDSIRQSRRAVLVEGYLDALRAHLGGYTFTVASLGTAVTVAQLRTLSRLAERVVLALDPDPAGQSAAIRTVRDTLAALAELTRDKGRADGAAAALDLRIAALPEEYGDPDELIRDRPQFWERALEESLPAFEFLYNQTVNSLDRSTELWRQEAIDRVLPVLQQFGGSPGWQAFWLDRLARDTDVDISLLQRSLPGGASPARRRVSRPRGRAPTQEVVSSTTARALTEDPALGIERALLALLLQLVVVPDEAASLLSEVSFQDPQHAALLAALLAWSKRENYDYEMFRETLPGDLQSHADDLRRRDVPLPADGKTSVAVAYHLARLRHFRLKSELARARSTQEDMAPEDRLDTLTGIRELLREIQDLEQNLDRLSRMVVSR